MTESRGSRWQEINAGRGGEPAAKPLISQETYDLINLTSRPEWAVFLGWLARKVEDIACEAANPNVSALLRVEGRRSLCREINDLASKVSDDRTGRQSDG